MSDKPPADSDATGAGPGRSAGSARAGGQSGKDRRQTQRDYFHFLSFSIARKAGARAVILMSLIYARYVFLFIHLTD